MRIVCISDTHYTDHILDQLEVPAGDVLIHAGDATFQGKPSETGLFMQWMNKQPHKVKLFIPGNHDFFFTHSQFPSDTVRTIVNGWYNFKLDGRIYSVLGMSWVKELPLWAFNSTEEQLERWLENVWGDHTCDLLVTHMPPYGILDAYKNTHHSYSGKYDLPAGELLGSKALRAKVTQKKPKLHVFGHIHEAHGLKVVGDTTFVNAAWLNDKYVPGYNPVVLDWTEYAIIPVMQ